MDQCFGTVLSAHQIDLSEIFLIDTEKHASILKIIFLHSARIHPDWINKTINFKYYHTYDESD